MNSHEKRMLNAIIKTAERLKEDERDFKGGLDCISDALKELYREFSERETSKQD